RPYLAGRVVTNARARLPGPQVSLIVGQKIDAVEAACKNLLIKFDGGLELRTHLGLHGSWHRYRPGETWRRPPSRAALVIEVPGAVAVCFDAPVVELFERRAEVVHPTISMLGPDLLDASYDQAEAIRRLRDPARAETAIGEAILDQRAVAGVGNVYKSEVLFMEKVDPFAPVMSIDDETLERILTTAKEQLEANARSTAPAWRRRGCGSTTARAGRATAAGRSSAPIRRAPSCRGSPTGARRSSARRPPPRRPPTRPTGARSRGSAPPLPSALREPRRAVAAPAPRGSSGRHPRAARREPHRGARRRATARGRRRFARGARQAAGRGAPPPRSPRAPHRGTRRTLRRSSPPRSPTPAPSGSMRRPRGRPAARAR